MTERLTTQQAARVRRAYRDAYAAENHSAEIGKFYVKYQNLYGVSHEALRAVVEADRARRATEYEALKKIHELERIAVAEVNRIIQKEHEQKRRPERKQKAHPNRIIQQRQKPKRLPKDKLSDVSVADYHRRATYCPVCHRDFGQDLMPPHGPSWHRCYGSDKSGVTQFAISQQKRKQDLEQKQDQKEKQKREHQQKLVRLPKGVSVADYYGRATYCPVCHRDFGQDLMPPHGPAPHGCKGSGKFGVTRYTIAQQGGAENVRKAKRGTGRGTSVHTVSGGLPGLGKRH